MIGYIEGVVKTVIRDTLIIENNGIGYRVHVPAGILASSEEGSQMGVWTHMAVRENSQDLFGFESKEELQWFEMLLTVSGVGPKSALSIMNSADTKTLRDAIARNDPSLLNRAFGIGKKTAEKIVLELREKVGAGGEGEKIEAHDGDVVEALISLGYSVKEARDAARALPKDIDSPEEKIRQAIRLASNTR